MLGTVKMMELEWVSKTMCGVSPPGTSPRNTLLISQPCVNPSRPPWDDRDRATSIVVAKYQELPNGPDVETKLAKLSSDEGKDIERGLALSW